jgi:hypothetical protein
VERCEGCLHEQQCDSFGTSEKCAKCEWQEECEACHEEVEA